MEFAIVAVPCAPVRRKPRHQAEMTNQLLFGDTVLVLKSKKSFWFKVRSLTDHYEGWITANMLKPVSEKTARLFVPHVTADALTTITINGQAMQVPMGAALHNYSAGQAIIDELAVEVTGNVHNREETARDPEHLQNIALRWLNAPYLWGGRTILGVDCSGFVQVTYKMLGVDLPRDAWQQAQVGSSVAKLKNSQPGDLAFFDDKDEIVHVGILLGNDRIIHSSGKVRIDTIDKKGIVHSETGKRTHSLQLIKRLF